MVWLAESIRQPDSHLDSTSHGDVLNMSNNKTIRGDKDERMKDWNAARPHAKARKIMEKWLLKTEYSKWHLVSVTVLFSTYATNQHAR